FDFADLYHGRMKLVSSNAIAGLILVLVVLLLFLRPIVAFWVSVGILISFAGAFIFMPMTGFSLNMLSMFAFLLVIGVVVDDAIVVGEAIHNEVEAGGKGVNAAIIASQLMAKPVIFAVLTTMIAFLPWLFIGGGTSQFTKHISYTIIFALSFSLIESFLILPSHLAHMKKQNKDGVYYRLQRVFAEGLMTFADKVYRPAVKTALRLRYFTVAFFFGLFMISVALMQQGWVAFKFEPEVQGTFVNLTVRMPEGSPWARSVQVVEEVERAAEALKAELNTPELEFVESVYIGADETDIDAYMTIVPAEQRKLSTKQVAELFRSKLNEIPDAEEINV
ncbi:MAG: efflux RND transporter permease subunit, partial [Oricola sp.]|nr:efflux RND transporter permease subunit [Oricola sp.]